MVEPMAIARIQPAPPFAVSPALDDVRLRAETLMRELGVSALGVPLHTRGWTFGFDRARVRFGRCTFRPGHPGGKTITLSTLHARLGWTAEVEDTVRHEIAHALDFETRGRSAHDAVWKRWAVCCGATPYACSRVPRSADADAPYAGVCPACGHRQPFYRAVVRTYRCPACRAAALAVIDRKTGTPATARPAFVGRCPACGDVQPFARRPRRIYACAACCRAHAHGRFDRRFALAIRRSDA